MSGLKTRPLNQQDTTSQVTSSSVTWRPIPEDLKKMDGGSVEERIQFLRANCRTISPEELHLMFNPAEVERVGENQFMLPAQRIESRRNWFILLPLIITWVSLGLAALAFAQSVTQNPKLAGQSFLYLWTNGFSDLSALSIGPIHMPVVLFGWHYLSFVHVALLDAFLLFILVLMSRHIHYLERQAQQKAAQLGTWIRQELHILTTQSQVRSLGPGPENKRPVWAVEVNETIQTLKSAMRRVESAMNTTEKRFSSTIDRFTTTHEQQNQTVSTLSQSMAEIRTAIDQLHGIYQRGNDTYERLDTVLPRVEDQFKLMANNQEQSAIELHKIADAVDKASSAINELARPFASANLSTLTDHIAQGHTNIFEQQQAILSHLTQLNANSTHPSPDTSSPKNIFSRIKGIFSRKNSKLHHQKKNRRK